MKNSLTMILMMALLCSCAKEAENIRGQISFTADTGQGMLDITTKADVVTSLSSFNVNCVTGVAGTSETSVFNSSFSGTTTYTGGKYWPLTDPEYKFYASNATITPSATGPTVSASNTTDVLCAVSLTPTYMESNSLTFNHIFARIGKCVVHAPSGYTVSSLTVKLTPKTGGKYNLYKGNGKTNGTGWSSTTAGSVTTIATATESSADNGLFLVPGSYEMTASYKLTKGAYSESFTKKGTVALAAGKINDISCTLPAGNATQISFTVTISPWSTNNVNLAVSRIPQ